MRHPGQTIAMLNMTGPDPWNNESDPDASDLRIVTDRMDRTDDAHDAPYLAMLELMRS